MNERKTNMNYTCPCCGKEYEYSFVKEADASENPEIDEKILTGELFQVECPDCKSVWNVNYPFLYTNKEKGFCISCGSIAGNSRKMSKLHEQFKIIRVVDDLRYLVEKNMLLQMGYDDRAIELCKEFIRKVISGGSDNYVNDLFCCGIENDTVVFFCRLGSRIARVRMEIDAYRYFENLLDSEIAGQYIYDQMWAQDFFEFAELDPVLNKVMDARWLS